MAGPTVKFETAFIESPDDGLNRLLALAPLAMAQLRADGTILCMNPPCTDLLVPLSCDGQPINLFDLLQPMASDLALRVREFAPAHGRICEGLHLQIDADHAGRDPQVLKLDLVKLDADRVIAIVEDVSAACRRAAELRRGQAWIQTLITGISDYALLTLDHAGVIQEWSPGVREVTGFDADATIGHAYCDIFCAARDGRPGRVRQCLQDADDNGWSVEEGWMRRASGEHYWASWLIAPLGAPDTPGRASGLAQGRRGYSLIIRDVGDRPESAEAPRGSALCDAVTGLLNQQAFFESAAILLERGACRGMRVSAVRFDVDHFQSLTDAHGPVAADAVLRHLAAGLSSTFRKSDIVARVGAHAFVVLMPDTSVVQAESTARHLRTCMAAQTLQVDGTVVPYTLSGGVVSGEASTAGLAELLKRANAAMHSAKSQGRNGIARWHEAG